MFFCEKSPYCCVHVFCQMCSRCLHFMNSNIFIYIYIYILYYLLKFAVFSCSTVESYSDTIELFDCLIFCSICFPMINNDMDICILLQIF